jgi:drug/metabolite transporter (DMT)-like permease
MRRPTADFMLLGTVTLWAFNFTVSKYILDQGFRPLAYASVRYGLAALIFVAITLVWERSLRIGRAELPLILLCTVLLFANQLSFVYALRFTTATTVALLFGTLPIFTAILARGSGVEHLSGRFWGAALVSFAGVVLVAVGSGGSLSANLKGDALAVSGAITWAGYSVSIAPLMRRYSPFRLSAVFLAAVTLPLALAGSGRTELGLRRARLGRICVRRRRPARDHELPLVHRDRPRRPVARLAVREPPAVPRSDHCPAAAFGDDHDTRDRRRPRHRRRHPPRAPPRPRARAAG